MRTIRVTGKGEIYVHPDTTELTITLEGMFQGYAETLLKSAERTEALKERLVPLGFSRTDLKTLRFSIDTEYEEYREHGAYKQRFLGYKFTHKMKLPFDSDNSRLGIILDALAGSGLHSSDISAFSADPTQDGRIASACACSRAGRR